MNISYALQSYEFNIGNATYTMIGTSIKNIRKNLADYDLPEVPEGIARSKATTRGRRELSDDYKRIRLAGVPIEQLKEPRHPRAFRGKMRNVEADDE
jgi:hypothetical protein